MSFCRGRRNRWCQDGPVEISDSTSQVAELIEAARETLPPAVADRWIALLRPAIRFRRAGPSEQPVGQLGGLPALPRDSAWPLSDAGHPLSFVAGLDLGRLPVSRLDIALPDSGTLLLFRSEPEYDFTVSARQSMRSLLTAQAQAARVVYVTAATTTAVQEAPQDAETYRAVPLAAELIMTGPDWDHPALATAVSDLSDADQAFMADPFKSDPFRMEMSTMIEHPRHRLGGYAKPVQGSVEMEAALQRQGNFEYPDPSLHEEAQKWISLVQIDSDDDARMQWGDCGCLYWLMQADDLAAGRFDQAAFTFQSS